MCIFIETAWSATDDNKETARCNIVYKIYEIIAFDSDRKR
jgi:hypothetical protein